jgi:hypothetical protein
MTYTRATTAQVPIGEWNVVESVVPNASTATINLRYPLRHTYRPAYRSDQIPYQVVAITNRPVHFGIEGVILEQWTNLPYEIHGLDIWFNGEFESLGCPAFRGRFIKFDYYGRMVVDWFVAGPPAHGRRAYGYVVDTTSTDVAGRCRVSSNGHIITHLHEGQTNVNIECDFACADSDALAASWGGVSCGENIQDVEITVRYHNCPGNFGYVNVGGNDEQNPSAARTRVRIQTSGKTPGPAFRNLANASATQPGTPLLLDAQGGGRGSPFFTDVGLGYARQLMPLPVDLADFTAITLPAVAATTPEGDAVVDFPAASDHFTGVMRRRLSPRRAGEARSDLPRWATTSRAKWTSTTTSGGGFPCARPTARRAPRRGASRRGGATAGARAPAAAARPAAGRRPMARRSRGKVPRRRRRQMGQTLDRSRSNSAALSRINALMRPAVCRSETTRSGHASRTCGASAASSALLLAARACSRSPANIGCGAGSGSGARRAASGWRTSPVSAASSSRSAATPSSDCRA